MPVSFRVSSLTPGQKPGVFYEAKAILIWKENNETSSIWIED